MRVLVVSDTHRDRWALQKAILAQPKAEVVVHLGDGEQEALEAKRSFPENNFTWCAETAIGEVGSTHT